MNEPLQGLAFLAEEWGSCVLGVIIMGGCTLQLLDYNFDFDLLRN